MLTIFDKEEFTEEDINYVIKNEIEESIHLDFKSAGALSKSEGKKREISKDVSSFANSDGGIILYGIEEKDHVAFATSFINGNEFSKEWLEQVINTTIQRHIKGLRIYPIRFNNEIAKSIYLVKIPKSLDSPHLAKDKRFYKRFNFESVYMEEYEIRELYGRKSKSNLLLGSCEILLLTDKHDDYVPDKEQYILEVSVVNEGDIAESEYKVNLYFNNFAKNASINWDNANGSYESTSYGNGRVKISTTKCSTIYPTEKLDVLKVKLTIDKSHIMEVLDSLDYEVKLFYANGEDDMRGNFKNLEFEKVK